MAWLSQNNFTASDYLFADDLNNLANDLRTWGGNVNGGGYTLSNVTLSGVQFEGSGQVTSVFGRSGDVVAEPGDYTAAMVGAVPTTRQVLPGPGLSGGGQLSSDVTLSVIPDASLQQIQAQLIGNPIGQRCTLNFIPGGDTTLNVSDNSAQNRVDITITSTGAGQNQTPWLSDINGAGFSLSNARYIALGTATQATSPTVGIAVTGGTGTTSIQVSDQVTTGYAAVIIGVTLGGQGQLAMFGPNAATNANYFQIGNTAGDIGFQTGAGGERMRIVASTGNIGISNSAPAYLLDVAGDVNTSTLYRVGGTQIAAANVLNAVDQTLMYVNPPWISSLSWSVIQGAPNFLVDPTTQPGDLIVRGAVPPPTRLPVGQDGYSLIADSSAPLGVSWALVAGGGGSGSQTPWLSDINAAGYALGSVRYISIGGATTPPAPTTGLNMQGTGGTGMVLIETTTTSYSGISLGAANGVNCQILCYGTAATTLQNYMQIYSGGAAMGFWTGTGSGTERIRITAAGNIGIANPAPAYALDIVGSVNCTGQFLVNGTPVGGGGQNQTPWLSDISAANYRLLSAGYISIGTNIGQTFPGMTIQGNSGSTYIQLQDNTSTGYVAVLLNSNGGACQLAMWGSNATNPNYLQFANTVGPIGLLAGGVERVRITNTGTVGIGTTVPGYMLDVNGDINTSGVFRVAGVPLVLGDPQTPWLQPVNAASNALYNLTVAQFTPAGQIYPSSAAGNPLIVWGGSGGSILRSPVGISTSATFVPGLALDLLAPGPTAAPWGIARFKSSSGNAFVNVDTSAAGTTCGLQGYLNGVWSGEIDLAGADGMLFWSQNASGPSICIAPDGNIGIGITNPTSILDVNGTFRSLNAITPTSGSGVEIAYAGNGFINAYDRDSGIYLPLFIDGQTLVLNASHGPVGIGTSSPSAATEICTNSDIPPSISLSGGGAFRISTDPWQSANALCMGASSSVAASWLQAIQAGVAANNLLLNPQGGNVAIGGTNAPRSYLSIIPINTNPNAYSQAQLTIGETTNNPGYGMWVGFGPIGGSSWSGWLDVLAGGVSYPLWLNPSGGDVWSGGNLHANNILTTGALGVGGAGLVGGSVNVTGNYYINGVPIATGGIPGIQGNMNYTSNQGGPGFYGILFNTLGGLTGSMSGSNDWLTTVLTQGSDERLKQNIRTLTGGLEIIKQLRPTYAEWNGLLGKTKGERIISINAQELQKVMPEAVHTFRAKLDEEETDVLGYDPPAITMHCVLAIQQLSKRIDELEKSLRSLKL